MEGNERAVGYPPLQRRGSESATQGRSMIGYDGKKISASGKGSKQRNADKEKYDKNYDAINWGRRKRPHGPTSSSSAQSRTQKQR